jgi:hypothetical protein
MRNLTLLAGAAAAALTAFAIACGGSSPSGSTSPSAGCTPSSSPNTLVIGIVLVCTACGCGGD